MGLLNKFLGYRWTLYFVQDGNQLIYAMHENSVVRMLGFVMRYFANGAQPVSPWSLVLNFNQSHKTIKLKPAHFSADGENVSRQLIREIQGIDPGWKVKGSDTVFEEVATKKKIPIRSESLTNINFQKTIDEAGKPKELTFFDVMDYVFGEY